VECQLSVIKVNGQSHRTSKTSRNCHTSGARLLTGGSSGADCKLGLMIFIVRPSLQLLPEPQVLDARYYYYYYYSAARPSYTKKSKNHNNN